MFGAVVLVLMSVVALAAMALSIYLVVTRESVADPLHVKNGGTGAATAAKARTNLGLGEVATRDTIPLELGGTGATTAAAARKALELSAVATTDLADLQAALAPVETLYGSVFISLEGGTNVGFAMPFGATDGVEFLAAEVMVTYRTISFGRAGTLRNLRVTFDGLLATNMTVSLWKGATALTLAATAVSVTGATDPTAGTIESTETVAVAVTDMVGVHVDCPNTTVMFTFSYEFVPDA